MKIRITNRIRAYFNVFFWLALTYFLAPYFYLRIFLQGKKNNKDSLKILVIQNGKIGDLVNSTPIFREIKERFPSARLTALVISRAAGVLKNNPRIDRIMLLDDYKSVTGKFKLLRTLRREKYDWAINVLPDSFTNIIPFWTLAPDRVTSTYKQLGEAIKLLSIFSNHRLEYKRHTPLMSHYLNLLKFIEIKDVSDKRELFIMPFEETKAEDFLREHNLSSNDLLVGISVSAGVRIREWQSDKFAGLADRLILEKNAKIIFIGSAADSSQVEKIQQMMQNASINAAGQFKLEELPALFKKFKLFISVDTGPLYIAAALDVPVVNVAGPIDLKEIYPLNSRSRIVQKKIHCIPCAHMFYAPRFCKESHLRCLKETSIQDIFEAAAFLI